MRGRAAGARTCGPSEKEPSGPHVQVGSARDVCFLPIAIDISHLKVAAAGRCYSGLGTIVCRFQIANRGRTEDSGFKAEVGWALFGWECLCARADERMLQIAR